MFLESNSAHTVTLAGTLLQFAEGERIHTENSYKYTREEFLQAAVTAGFGRHRFWTDENSWFGLFYLYSD
jgi:uncharacterized SAM-dependent methyltransferase